MRATPGRGLGSGLGLVELNFGEIEGHGAGFCCRHAVRVHAVRQPGHTLRPLPSGDVFRVSELTRKGSNGRNDAASIASAPHAPAVDASRETGSVFWTSSSCQVAFSG